MSRSSFLSLALYVAWRNLRVLLRTPSLLVPALLFPLFFFIAFVGALSTITDIPGFKGGEDYTGFQYVFALLQSAGFTGATGGFALAEDFESGFVERLKLSAPNQLAIPAGYVLAMLVRGAIAIGVLTGVAFAFGMDVGGGPLDLVALYGLTVLLVVAATLWATGVALHVRSYSAAPGMVLPIFLPLFLAPVFVPLDLLHGWLHAVAVVNPFTRLLNAGRGFLVGDPEDVLWAFGAIAGMTVLLVLWAISGVRSAARA